MPRHHRRRTLALGALTAVALSGAGLSALGGGSAQATCVQVRGQAGNSQTACWPTPLEVTGCARPTVDQHNPGVTLPRTVTDRLGRTDVCFS